MNNRLITIALLLASFLGARAESSAQNAAPSPSPKGSPAPAVTKTGTAAVPATAVATEPDFKSEFIAVGFSPNTPAFSYFSVDSLGHGKVQANPALVPVNSLPFAGSKAEGKFVYQAAGKTAWKAECAGKILTLSSEYVPGMEVPPFVLNINQKENHATLLGMMPTNEPKTSIPCILHLADMGSFRITCNVPEWKLDYAALRRVVKPPFVRVSFPPATAEHPRVVYQLEAVAIYPDLPGIAENPLYDGFRRNWLNIFQVHPRLQKLANNSSSDACSMCMFEYSNLARHTPPLAEGLSCLDLIRMSMDRYLAGELGYGQKRYGIGGAIGRPSEPPLQGLVAWHTPADSLDTLPSFLIAACDYVEGSGDLAWGRANYKKLAAWAREMFALDKDGNGLIEYLYTGNYNDRPSPTKRPANWWDCINFGHEDAFSNALAYRAGCMMTSLAEKLGQKDDSAFFAEKSEKLRAAYAPTFLNPETGVLAGWKSADGQLHDYYFTYIQGMAVTFGLLDKKTANSVMDKILAKMEEVGYRNFSIGLPGNLVPVKKGDYVSGGGLPFGSPKLEDGSDGFQIYENGGATGCWAYYTIKALFDLGRVDEARRILHPMLEGYAKGEFQGFGKNGGLSRDWRDWKGGCHGYEGLLVDNYHALLSVLDDVKAKQ